MPICGLNVNISSIQGDITAQISGFINLDDVLTTPDKLSEYKSTFESGMSSLKAKADSLVPDIPISASGFTSLRDELSAYVSVPSVSGLADITSKFGGLTSLTGFADINLNDLASSAFSLGASFDPCSLAGDLKIPNIVADSSGQLDALTDQVPDIGATVMSLKRQIDDSKVYDSIALATTSNVSVLKSVVAADVAKAKTAIAGATGNVTSQYGGGAFIKTLPSGGEMVKTIVEEAKELQTDSVYLEDESTLTLTIPSVGTPGVPPGYEVTASGRVVKTALQKQKEADEAKLEQEVLDGRLIDLAMELQDNGTVNGMDASGLTVDDLDNIQSQEELDTLLNDVEDF